MPGMTLNVGICEKIIEVSVGSGGAKPRVHACFVVRTPDNAVADGLIKDPAAVAGALRAELNVRRINVKRVIFTVSSGRVATREVTVPPVRPARVKAIVDANVQDYFPVDIAKYQVAHRILNTVEKGEGAGVQLVVMAAPMMILEGYFKVAELAGLQVSAIDYQGNSIYQALQLLSAPETVMHVTVGCGYICLTAMKGKRMLMQRSMTFGIEDYITARAEGKGSYVGTLEAVAGGKTVAVAEEGAPPSYDDTLGRIVGTITRTMDYFNSSNWTTPIEKLVLSGVGGGTPGLADLLSSVGVPVEVMNGIGPLHAPAGIAAPFSSYLACVGSGIGPVDLIPPQFLKTRRKKRETSTIANSLRLGVIALSSLVLLSAVLGFVSFLNWGSADLENRQLKVDIANMAGAETLYQTWQIYQGDAAALENFEKTIQNPNDRLLDLIKELEEKLPSQITVLSLSFTQTGVNMNVTVRDKEAVAKTIVQLRSFKSIEVVTVGQYAENEDDTGVKQVSFAVSCNYPAPEPVVPADGQTVTDSSTVTG